MQIDEHIALVQSQVAAAAGLGDERTQQVAAALTTAVIPAVRLAIMSALSAAADEITAALLDVPGSPAVAVALDGADVRIQVRTSEVAADTAPVSDDAEATARISLRLSEALKADVESAARGAGISVNSWLVRAASNAFNNATHATPSWGDQRRNPGSSHRMTGWING